MRLCTNCGFQLMDGDAKFSSYAVYQDAMRESLLDSGIVSGTANSVTELSQMLEPLTKL